LRRYGSSTKNCVSKVRVFCSAEAGITVESRSISFQHGAHLGTIDLFHFYCTLAVQQLYTSLPGTASRVLPLVIFPCLPFPVHYARSSASVCCEQVNSSSCDFWREIATLSQCPMFCRNGSLVVDHVFFLLSLPCRLARRLAFKTFHVAVRLFTALVLAPPLLSKSCFVTDPSLRKVRIFRCATAMSP